VDISTRKIGKKIAAAATANAAYVITVGEDEAASDMYTIKHLETGQETTGSLSEIISSIVMQT
jgi:histidyl-tRNA synthetase